MTTSSPFLRAARHIGDFGNPFYEEERHRDVWNEASAFGFQLFLLTAFSFATAGIWLVGTPALRWVQVGVLLIGAISAATILYAQRLGVDVMQPQRLSWPRLLPFLALLALLMAGLVRAAADGGSSFDRGTAAGAVVGATLAVGVLALGVRQTRRAARAGEPAD